MSKELITKKDYEILGIEKNATPHEVSTAYEKLLQEYHPEKIKLEKLRKPSDLEVKKYQEIEKVYKKFDFEIPKYKCRGWRNGPCSNRFFPCLWEKVENGHRHLFCSQECYNSEYENKSQYDELVEKHKKEDREWETKKLVEAKRYLEKTKVQEIKNIKRYLERAKVKVEQLAPNNRNYEQEINQFEIKDADDSEWVKPLHEIINRVEKDIQSKSKKEESNEKCDNCGNEIKKHREGNKEWAGIGSVDNEGNHYTFCSEECCNKGMKGKGKTVIKKNAFAILLKWMEKEGITKLALDPKSGKLVVKYGQNNSKTIEDDNLTSEQKEIKEFFRQTGKNQLSQSQVREEVAREGKNGDNNKWLGPVVGIVIATLVITFIGVIVYKNKKKNY